MLADFGVVVEDGRSSDVELGQNAYVYVRLGWRFQIVRRLHTPQMQDYDTKIVSDHKQ